MWVTAGIRNSLRSVCSSAGQPADCQIAAFGCTEWSDLSRFVYFAVGAADLVAYLIGAIILFFKIRRENRGFLGGESAV
jgi:hypothetical protein